MTIDMSKISKKLQRILTESGWSQEVLAGKLGVSFVTLNSWVNGRSEPRKKILPEIESLYFDIVGMDDITADSIVTLKERAMKKHCSVQKILKSRQLLEKLTVSLTYHTNATEGSTMSEKDVAKVVLDNKVLRNRTAVEQREAVNHQQALYFLLDMMAEQGKDFVVTPELIKLTHLRLMGGVISDAGCFRKHRVRIRGSFVPLANPLKVPELIEDWCKMVNRSDEDKIELLARSHAEFERIHPFSDGNGRTGRLMLFVLALKAGLMPPILRKERRSAYYKYLEIAQTRENSVSLQKFIAEEILATAEMAKM